MKQVFLPVIFFCLLSGCGKHNDKPGDPGNRPDPIPPPDVRIRSINNDTYSYDSLGRLSQALYSNSIVVRTDYAYTNTAVIATDFDGNGNVHPGGAVATIGPNGLATEQKYKFDPGMPALVLSFTYNAKRQLVEELESNEGTAPDLRTVYYYSQYDLDSLKVYYVPDNTLIASDRFEYYTDKYNTLGRESNGISFLGVWSAHLVKKDVQVNGGATPVTTVTEYTYEFDAQNRAVKSHKIVNGTTYPEVNYTYY